MKWKFWKKQTYTQKQPCEHNWLQYSLDCPMIKNKTFYCLDCKTYKVIKPSGKIDYYTPEKNPGLFKLIGEELESVRNREYYTSEW
jgi:hypothetical protein